MAVKYVFVTGGVVSGLGKGITAASLGRLLKARGYTVTMQKFDPYINIDPGTMNPVQHGEVFVTDDGAETDLDLGHYERFIDENLTKNSNVTTGKIYWSVLQKERRGDFGGGTVQVIPHITNEIKSRFYRNPSAENTEIAIIEVGGTVGDIESQPFLESIRQFQHEKGRDNVILIHVTLIPYLRASQEMKTKPTQASVKELQGMGIQPDIIVCRSEHPLDNGIKDKISLFCNLPADHVLQNLDVDYLYEAPLAMEKEHLAQVVCECLHLDCPKPDLSDWETMVDNLRHPVSKVRIALVGKYVQLHDAYISVVEALKHGGIYSHTTVEIKWVAARGMRRSMLRRRRARWASSSVMPLRAISRSLARSTTSRSSRLRRGGRRAPASSPSRSSSSTAASSSRLPAGAERRRSPGRSGTSSSRPRGASSNTVQKPGSSPASSSAVPSGNL